AAFFEFKGRLEQARVFDGRNQCSTWRREGIEREVVGLRSAAGEDDFTRFAIERCRNSLLGTLHRLPRLAAESVLARRVPRRPGEVRQHFRKHRRVEGRRGVVVQIDRWHRYGSRRAERMAIFGVSVWSWFLD